MNPSKKEIQAESNQEICEGTVVGITRRHAAILSAGAELTALVPGRLFQEIAIGDRVKIQTARQGNSIASAARRKNCLSRTYDDKTKSIAANLDHLLIVTAVPPLFNTPFVDRVLTVAHSQNIPVSIIVNKIDLESEDLNELLAIYSRLDIPVLPTSAKSGLGMDTLQKLLSSPQLNNVALAGISGVGKSSLLNVLVPGAKQRTSTVSRKTGHGRQTTSSAYGFRYPRAGAEDLLLIDLPGIQSFGVANLSKPDVLGAFPEFVERRGLCEYLDCWHLAEPHCAVKDALDRDEISISRYESYIKMLDEIEAAKEY